MSIESVFLGEIELSAKELIPPSPGALPAEHEEHRQALALYRRESTQRNPQCGRCSSRVVLVEPANGSPYFKHNGQDDKHRGTAHEEACAWYTGGAARVQEELPRWKGVNTTESTLLPGVDHGIERTRKWLQAGLRALGAQDPRDFSSQRGRSQRHGFHGLMGIPRAAAVPSPPRVPSLLGLPQTGEPQGLLAAFLRSTPPPRRTGALPGSVMAALQSWQPAAEGILQQRRLLTLKETLLNPLLRDELALFLQMCCELACRVRAKDAKARPRAMTLHAIRELQAAREAGMAPRSALVAATFGSREDVNLAFQLARAAHRDDRQAYDELVAPAIKAMCVMLETFPFLEAQKERMVETMGTEAAAKASFIYLVVRPEAPNVAKVGMTSDLVSLVGQLSGRQGAYRARLVEAALCYDWTRTESAVRRALADKTGGIISRDPQQPDAREWIEWPERPALAVLAKTFATVASRVAAEVAVSQRRAST